MSKQFNSRNFCTVIPAIRSNSSAGDCFKQITLSSSSIVFILPYRVHIKLYWYMQVIRKYVWILYITGISLSTTLLLGVVTGLKCISASSTIYNKYCNLYMVASKSANATSTGSVVPYCTCEYSTGTPGKVQYFLISFIKC